MSAEIEAEQIEVQCIRPGCGETVMYKREVVHGFSPGGKASNKVSVYLTCVNGHTFKYVFDRTQ